MALATTTDVQTRLGRALTDTEEDTVEFLIEAVTGLIANAVGKAESWADTLTPVPRVIKFVTVEAVLRAINNPQGVASFSKQLGAFQQSQTFRRDEMGLVLTPTEEKLVRRAVHGRTTGSPSVGSILDDIYCLGS